MERLPSACRFKNLVRAALGFIPAANNCVANAPVKRRRLKERPASLNVFW
jgi:hypothetical protein